MSYNLPEESKICKNCKYYIPQKDGKWVGMFCGNPWSGYYGRFRNDYKSCEKFEPYIESGEISNE